MRIALAAWIILAISYVLVNYLQPVNRSLIKRYHLSVNQVHGIDVTVIVPIIVIFFLAWLAFYYLRSYCLKIKGTADGRGFSMVAYGIGVFAYGTLVTSIITTVLKWLALDHPKFVANYTRITNYLAIIVPLVAFIFISEGVRRLAIVARLRIDHLKLRWLLLAVVVLGASYSFVTFHQNTNPFNSITNGPNIYYLASWLVLFTIVIPYVFAWAIGLFSVAQMMVYRRKVNGIVYRRALNLVAFGLGIVLLSYIVLEYLTSLSSKLSQLNIGWLLVIIYCFLLLLGLGYLLLAIGSSRLKKIEDI